MRNVLVGGLLTLAVTLLVQWFVVPRVEARKRREERWETDVRALGELLTVEMPAALTALQAALWWRGEIQAVRVWSMGERELYERRASNELRDAHDRLKLADHRLSWLVARVRAFDATAEGLSVLSGSLINYRIAASELDGYVYARERELPAQEAIAQEARKAREAVKRMQDATEALMQAERPPRRSWRRRLSQRRDHLLAPASRWRARRAVRREQN